MDDAFNMEGMQKATTAHHHEQTIKPEVCRIEKIITAIIGQRLMSKFNLKVVVIFYPFVEYFTL